MFGIAQASLDRYGHFIKNDHASTMWKVHARADRKVEAIKAFRAQTGAGLKEAKDIVEAYAMDSRQWTIDSDAYNGAVKTTTITLPNNTQLQVIDNGIHAQVLLTRHIGQNIRSEDVLQAVADFSLRYGSDQ